VRLPPDLVNPRREAVDDALAVLAKFREVDVRISLAFTATKDEERRILDAGYLWVVRGRSLQEIRRAARVVKLTPIDRLLVETDATVLSARGRCGSFK